MAYEVTATRRRPRTLDELVGQEFVVASIRNSLQAGRIAHAYLLAGPRGVGKTSLARILAKSLNCVQGPTATPCGTCSSCLEVARGASLDVIEIDGASNTSVNDVRQIRDEVVFAPNAGRYKVYIIDEVHMLSTSAFNALLKTIEEPPPYVVFVFATTEVHKVPATIRSRCQQFSFRLIPMDETVRLLEEAAEDLGIHAEPDALFWIAKESTGSLRDAYTLLDQSASFTEGRLTLKAIRDKLGVMDLETLNDLGLTLVRSDRAGALESMHRILDGGVSIEQFVADLAEYFRNLLFLKHGIERRNLLGYPPEDFRKEVVDGFAAEQMEKAVEMLLGLYRDLRYSLSPVFEVELVVARLAELDRLVSPEEIRELVAGLRAEFVPGRQGAARKAATQTASPPARASRPTAAVTPTQTAPVSTPQDERELWRRIREACTREKPLLAPALDKAAFARPSAGLIVLRYAAEDRFHAQMAEADRTLIGSCAQVVLGSALSVRVEQGGAGAARAQEEDVDRVKRIFRGVEVDEDKEGGA